MQPLQSYDAFVELHVVFKGQLCSFLLKELNNEIQFNLESPEIEVCV